MLFAVTKRKLKKAITLAREEGKIPARLPDDTMQTMLFYKSPCLYWPIAISHEGIAAIAEIHVRSDATIYIGYASPLNNVKALTPFEPRSSHLRA